MIYVTCIECGAEYDLNYSERDGDATYNACPDCGTLLDGQSVAVRVLDSLVSDGE